MPSVNHPGPMVPMESGDINWILANKNQVYSHLLAYPNRDFSTELLNSLVDLRKTQHHGIGIEDIMFACLLVTLHQQIEDCLLIWKAKNTDFDTLHGTKIRKEGVYLSALLYFAILLYVIFELICYYK